MILFPGSGITIRFSRDSCAIEISKVSQNKVNDIIDKNKKVKDNGVYPCILTKVF
jgi:hypothetical protein